MHLWPAAPETVNLPSLSVVARACLHQGHGGLCYRRTSTKNLPLDFRGGSLRGQRNTVARGGEEEILLKSRSRSHIVPKILQGLVVLYGLHNARLPDGITGLVNSALI